MPIDRRPFVLGPGGVTALAFAGAILACEPVPPAPPLPVRDTSYDADLDAPPSVIPPRDAPSIDAPRADVPGRDGGDPDFDGGTLLPIDIDGIVDEPEWLEGVEATSDATDVGAFDGSRLTSLAVLHDDANVYFAIEAAPTNGYLILFVDTGATGVDPTFAGLFDVSGVIDAALSRPQVVVDPDFRPSFGWGVDALPRSGTTAEDDVGWRELEQNAPHRHLTTDFTACGPDACETRISRANLGFPSTLRFTARIANEADASNLALPPDSDAAISILTFGSRSITP
jgi:hypothetical protein